MESIACVIAWMNRESFASRIPAPLSVTRSKLSWEGKSRGIPMTGAPCQTLSTTLLRPPWLMWATHRGSPNRNDHHSRKIFSSFSYLVFVPPRCGLCFIYFWIKTVNKYSNPNFNINQPPSNRTQLCIPNSHSKIKNLKKLEVQSHE